MPPVRRGQSLLSALGHGVPDYPEHEIRQSFYFQLARISRSNISIEAGQMKDLLEKLLARIIGEALGAYYFWCERNRCVSENFKRLDRSLCEEGRAGSRQREEIDRLLVAHAGGETSSPQKCENRAVSSRRLNVGLGDSGRMSATRASAPSKAGLNIRCKRR